MRLPWYAERGQAEIAALDAIWHYAAFVVWTGIFGPWGANLAWRRHRNEKRWGGISAVFGPLAIIALYVLPRLPSPDPPRPSALDRLEKAPRQLRS